MATILMTRRRRWIVHVTRRETSIAKTALHWIPEGKCKRHNPKNTWRRTVEKSEFCFRFLFLFFSLITIFFFYVFCFCEITLSLHCIFSLYTVLVLFSSFSLPFLSFLLQVLVLSTFTRSYHHFYLFSFLFFFVSEQLSFWASLFIRVFFFFFPIVVIFSFIHS